MRRLLMLIFACATMTVVARSDPPDGYYGHRGNFGVFYSSLSPYGEWIDFNFGYAWRPARVAHGWRPYLYGRWVWTDYGWYWVSDEPFGWATFHYGRWYYDDYYGWIWIPDNTWGPSWVEWRYDDDYIGWAPLPPYAYFDVSIGVRFTDRWVAPYNYWNFVPCRYVVADRVVDYVQPVERTRRIFGNTRSVVDIRADHDRVINRGIDPGLVERRANVRVERVDVLTRERGEGERFVRDGNRQRVEVFRPRLDTQIRTDAARPPEARRAEHPLSFGGPRDHQGGGRTPEGAPFVGRDTKIQERGQGEQRPPSDPRPERRMEAPKPPAREVPREGTMREPPPPRNREYSRDREMREPPAPRNREYSRGREMRDPPPPVGRPDKGQQMSRVPRPERGGPEQRQQMGQRGAPKREPPKEKGREGRDGGRDRRP